MEVSHRSSHGVIQNIQLCSPTRHQPLLRYTLRDHLALQALLLLFCLYEKKYILKRQNKHTNKHKATTTKNNYKKTTNKQTNKLKFVSYQLGFLIKLWLAWIICDYFKFIFKHTTPGPRNQNTCCVMFSSPKRNIQGVSQLRNQIL